MTEGSQQWSMLHVSVWRGGESGALQVYEVPRLESQTVLDVVTHIQRRIDPTLSYRFACRVGMCGSCAMTVNGRARWTCRTHVSRVADGRAAGDRAARQSAGGEGPRYRHDRVLRQVGEGARPVRGRGHAARTISRACRPASPERRQADAGIECIGCGVCYARATSSRGIPDYLGPAALNRAWTLVNDARDTGNRARLAAVAGDAGCHACHTHMSCTERCPKQISPTAAIAGLKRAAMAAALKGELRDE